MSMPNRIPGKRTIALVILLSAFGSTHHAVAQVAVPSTAQPGSVERQLAFPPEPQPLPGRTAPAPIGTAAPIPAGAADIRFKLTDVDVKGARSLSSADWRAVYASYIGKEVTLAQVYGFANAITAIYRSHGYLLCVVVVPAQSVDNGQVTLRAVEGYLSNVEFRGYEGIRKGLFEGLRERLMGDRPLRTATLERVLLLLNDLSGIRAQSILRPAASEEGAADLVITLERHWVAASLGGNNRGAVVQGPTQYNAGLTINSPFGTLDSTAFQYVAAAPSSRLELYQFSHTERLTSNGLDLSLSGIHSESSPNLGIDYSAFNFATNTTQAQATLSYPFLRTRTDTVQGHLSLTYEDDSSKVLGTFISQDHISAVRGGLRWDLLDGFDGVNLVDLTVARGVHFLGSSQPDNILASRADGQPDFTKGNLYLARLQSLGGPFSLLVAGEGQYSFNRLLEAEEFAFGGEPFGRAYDPSEIVGDSGIAGKAELRWTYESHYGFATTLYGFGDRGGVWRRNLPFEAGIPESEFASSAGGGLRFSIGSWVTGYVEYAVPLDHVVAALGDMSSRVFAGGEILFQP